MDEKIYYLEGEFLKNTGELAFLYNDKINPKYIKWLESELYTQTKVKNNGVLDSVSHSYYQVVYNGYNDDMQEVTAALPTLEQAKKALEANKAYFNEDMYIIAKINCA